MLKDVLIFGLYPVLPTLGHFNRVANYRFWYCYCMRLIYLVFAIDSFTDYISNYDIRNADLQE